jgi:hypothetical protein
MLGDNTPGIVSQPKRSGRASDVYDKKWYENNKRKKSKYYQQNKPRILEKQYTRIKNNKEENDRRRDQDYQKHRERRVAAVRKYRKSHREEYQLVIKKWRLKHYFGLSIEDFTAMVKKQNGRCAICGMPPGNKGLCVDHDHASGENRGLLCQTCNTGIGLLKEDPKIMKNAIAYLKGEMEWE